MILRFQATKFSKAEIFQLLETINANADDEKARKDGDFIGLYSVHGHHRRGPPPRSRHRCEQSREPEPRRLDQRDTFDEGIADRVGDAPLEWEQPYAARQRREAIERRSAIAARAVAGPPGRDTANSATSPIGCG